MRGRRVGGGLRDLSSSCISRRDEKLARREARRAKARRAAKAAHAAALNGFLFHRPEMREYSVCGIEKETGVSYLVAAPLA